MRSLNNVVFDSSLYFLYDIIFLINKKKEIRIKHEARAIGGKDRTAPGDSTWKMPWRVQEQGFFQTEATWRACHKIQDPMVVTSNHEWRIYGK